MAVPEELNQILAKMLAKNRQERTSTATRVAEQLNCFLKRTATQKQLDAIPVILQRVSTANIGAEVEQADFVDSDAGTPREGEVTTVNDIPSSTPSAARPGTLTTGVAGSPTFQPAFSALLRQIEADCDVSGPLGKDSRSLRLWEFVRELAQPESSLPAFADVPVVEKRIEPLTAKFTNKADSVQDFSAVESIAPSKWPAEDTVLNDIARAGFRFDPASITSRSDDEVDTRLMIKQLLAAVDLDSEKSTGDSGIPLVMTSDLSRRKTGSKVVKPTQRGHSPVFVWSVAGLGALAAIVLVAIVYSIM